MALVRRPSAKQSGRRHWRHVAWLFEWPTIGACAAVAVVLGYAGFARMYELQGVDQDFWGTLYPALQLFVMESGAVTGPVTWPLQIARFLAPAVTMATAAKAFAIVLGEQLRRARLRLMRDHTVICGLGRKGLLVAEDLAGRGERVVVVEKDEWNDHLLSAREYGIAVVLGDASEAEVLRRARVARARRLLAVCGDDGVNAAVAVHVLELCRGRATRPLDCVIHIVDDNLCRLLREQELRGDAECGVRVEFFNAYERGAHLLLRHHPPFDAAAATAVDSAPHVVVVGCGGLGSSLVTQAGREWWHASRGSGRRLTVTVVDREARGRCEAIEVRWPRLREACDLVPVELDVTSPYFERGDFLDHRSSGRPPVRRVYVCLDHDSLSLAAALAVHASAHGRGLPVVLRMSGLSGLARLTTCSVGGFEGLECFSVTGNVCAPEQLFAGTHETLARAIHEEYLADQIRAGVTPRGNPAAVRWEQLPEELRESNLRQADHIVAKLAAAGYDIAPLRDWDAKDFAFAPDEVERMAQMEHARWMSERLAAGWTYAPGPKDPERRTNPFLLKPWDELPDEQRDIDRGAVTDLPRLLASVGLQVVRSARASGAAAAGPAPT
jgi:hypothetical protein